MNERDLPADRRTPEQIAADYQAQHKGKTARYVGGGWIRIFTLGGGGNTVSYAERVRVIALRTRGW